MPILVVAACLGLPKNLSSHRGSHQWQLYVVTATKRNQLDRGWTPYLHPVCASHLPNAVGPDLEPRVEERQLWGSILEMLEEKCVQYTAETKVLYFSHLALAEMVLHVAQ